MSIKLCVIPGDGIGAEVITAALQVAQRVVPDITIIEAQAGWKTFQETGTALPTRTLELAKQADAILFGAGASPSLPVPGYHSPIVALRKALDLYANIRPTIDFGLPVGLSIFEEPIFHDIEATLHNHVDLVIVRENTEDLYSGRERLEDNGATAIAERVITRKGSERIMRMAFELAESRRQKTDGRTIAKVTIVHKANVLRLTDGLFLTVALEVAQKYPHIVMEELLVDTAAMHLARSPERFDVIVTTNVFGDILSDIACIHGGGLGLASSANIGERYALFEPVHGAALDIQGIHHANPLAAIGCIAMLLEWMARHSTLDSSTYTGRPLLEIAQHVQNAIAEVVHNGPYTPDLGGTATTQAITNAILARLET